MLVFLSINLDAQISKNPGELLDTRDGKVYQTIEVGNTIWLTENMRFETTESENHEINSFGDIVNSYYYPYEELDEVCPSGYRLPTSIEWKEYVKLLMELKHIPNSYIEFKRLHRKGDDFETAQFKDQKLKPFESPNPLKLKAFGHTRSGKIVVLGTMNIWMQFEDYSDAKYHLHLNPWGYSIHTHDHHITTKKKKLRKFSVRCVSEKM